MEKGERITFHEVPFSVDKDKLRAIYSNCTRSFKFYEEKCASTTNALVDDKEDYQYIVDNIIKRAGIDLSIVNNTWEYEDDGTEAHGINFHVLHPGDYVRPHTDKTRFSDTNVTKLNVLVNESTNCPVHFCESGLEYYYEHPVLLNVGLEHDVKYTDTITEPRIILQIFLNEKYETCLEMINENHTY